MALIVEDGSVVPNAESYVSVDEADSYHDSRGTVSWSTMTVTEKERALRRATDFMKGRYRSRWKGGRVHPFQALDWPRQGVVTDDMGSAMPPYYAFIVDYRIVPLEVKQVCAELALRAAAGPLIEDRTQKLKEETIGPIKTIYDQNATDMIQYTQVDEMIKIYLGRGGNGAIYKLART